MKFNLLVLIILLSSFSMSFEACTDTDSFSSLINKMDLIDEEIANQNKISGAESSSIEQITQSVKLQGDLFKLKQACGVYLDKYLSLDLNCNSGMSNSDKALRVEIIEYNLQFIDNSFLENILNMQKNSCREVIGECSQYGADEVDLKYNSTQIEELILSSVSSSAKKGSSKYNSLLFSGLINLHLADKELEIYTLDEEEVLADQIIKESERLNKRLNPGEVLSICLDVMDQKVADGILLCHNVLRDRLRDTRTYGSTSAQLEKALDQINGNIEQNQKVIESSPNERAVNVAKSAISDLTMAKKNIELLNSLEVIRNSDNVGAWYHLYGTLIEGYGVWGWLGEFGVWFEHKVFKRVKGSNYDAVEHCWDNWGLDIGAKIKERLSSE